MIVDLHVHMKKRRRNPDSYEELMIQAGIAAGLQGIAITEHIQYLPVERMAELRIKYDPFKIFWGVEVQCDEKEDILVLGKRLPELCSGGSWERIRSIAKNAGAFTVLAHPLRRRNSIMVKIDLATDKPLPDGMEVRSSHTSPAFEKKLEGIALLHNIMPMEASDAHKPKLVGQWKMNFPDNIIATWD